MLCAGHIAEGGYNFTSVEVAQSKRDGPALSFDLNQYDDDLQMFDDPLDAAQRDDPLDAAQRDDPLDAAQRDDALDATQRDDPLDAAQRDGAREEAQRGAAARGSSKKPVKEPKKSKKREDPMVEVMTQYVEIKRKQAEEESALLVGSKNAQEFTITKCIAVLHKMQSIQRSERAAAYKVFKTAENREIFINSSAEDEESTVEWLRTEMAELHQRT